MRAVGALTSGHYRAAFLQKARVMDADAGKVARVINFGLDGDDGDAWLPNLG